MTEHQPPPQDVPPVRVCQKCRKAYPLDAFPNLVGDEACICQRCLTVMGYLRP